jgi:hypothetical protein
MMALLGLDPDELRMRGHLSHDDRDAITRRCFGCAEAATCDGWMAAQRGPVAQVPVYCRNKGVFALLDG